MQKSFRSTAVSQATAQRASDSTPAREAEIVWAESWVVAQSDGLGSLPAFARATPTTTQFFRLVFMPMIMRALFGEKLKSLQANWTPRGPQRRFLSCRLPARRRQLTCQFQKRCASAAAAMTATTTAAGVFRGKSLAVSRVFLFKDVERCQADVRDFLIAHRDFGFHRFGIHRGVSRRGLLRL